MSPPPSLRAAIRSPVADSARGRAFRHRLRPQLELLTDNLLFDDRPNLGSRIDASELVSHLRRAHAVGGSIEHGADGGAKRFLRRLVGCARETDRGPRAS